VGETGCTLRQRFAGHRYCIKLNNKNTIKKTPIGIHFNSINHNLSHLKVTPIEFIGGGSVLQRRARETFWQLCLGTLFPLGLNNFPVHLDFFFDNLEITTHTDLNTFWNQFTLDLENNTQTSS